MPQTCFVRECKSGYKIKANAGKKWHFFSAPIRDTELLQKWESGCMRKDIRLNEKSKVCHKHFTASQIVKEKRLKLDDGTTYIYAYKNWRLAEGAYPCVFQNEEPYQESGLDASLETVNVTHNELVVVSIPETTSDPLLEVVYKPSDMQQLTFVQDSALRPTLKFVETSVQDSIPNGPMKISDVKSLKKTCDKGTQKAHKCDDYKRLYRRWYHKHRRLAQKMKKQSSQRKDGVFINFTRLNSRERLFVSALARKSNATKMSGMRYHPDHMIEAMSLASKGKKTYNLVRDNSLRILPHYRTVQKLRSRLTSEAGTNWCKPV